MKSRNQILLEKKIRKMVKEELLKESTSNYKYYRMMEQVIVDITDLMTSAENDGNDKDVQIFQQIQDLLTKISYYDEL